VPTASLNHANHSGADIINTRAGGELRIPACRVEQVEKGKRNVFGVGL
jgi:hypothetical protein